MVLNSLPLFPLGSVLYPQGHLPLRIFEVRYLDMINKVIQANAPFGVVALKQGIEVQIPQAQELFADVGTIATVIHHESPQPGLKLIHCLGAQRYRILRRERLKHGLWIADVEHIEPDVEIAPPDELASCVAALRSVMAKLSSEAPGVNLDLEDNHWNSCSWVANRWCEILPIPLPLKQRMLELDNPIIRLELISDILEKFDLA
jgi:uncharacterized protein